MEQGSNQGERKVINMADVIDSFTATRSTEEGEKTLSVTFRHTENEVPPRRTANRVVRRYSILLRREDGAADAEVSFPFWGSIHEMDVGEHSPTYAALDSIAYDMEMYKHEVHDTVENEEDDKYLALDHLSNKLGLDAGETLRVYETLKEQYEELQDVGITVDDIRFLEQEARRRDGEDDE